METVCLQELATKLLDMSTVWNMTSEVDYILAQHDYENAPLTWEDATNCETTGLLEVNGYEFELTEEERDDLLHEYSPEWFEELVEDVAIEDNVEIFQWFLVDDRLAHWLEKKGQVILNDKFWGRQAYGQALCLDHCIQQIAVDQLG